MGGGGICPASLIAKMCCVKVSDKRAVCRVSYETSFFQTILATLGVKTSSTVSSQYI